MDLITRSQRSANMARIRDRDTGPELTVRRLAHRIGYRYRLHRADLPGTPDLVFPGQHKVVFVNGCFWHRHAGCRFAYTPKTNVEFWTTKFTANTARDERVRKSLEDMGWSVLTIWECETADLDSLAEQLKGYLGNAYC
jgi:DNA mismatch endonuclease (patch repair protein)